MPQAERSRFPKRMFIILAAVALVAAALIVFLTPRPQGGGGVALIGGPFALKTAEGQTLTDKDLRGEPFLVYFGYTHCPDVCPTTLAQISDVLAKMPDKPIKALFITVDPDRDTAKSMADYVSSFDKRIIGLSGTPKEIDQVEKAYRVYARKAPGKDGDYSMDHSSVVYLMDKNGRFVEAFNLDRPAKESAKELETYL